MNTIDSSTPLVSGSNPVSEMSAFQGGQYLCIDSPLTVARWRPLVNFILAIPHLVIASALGRLSSIVFFVYWLGFVFTGKRDPGMYGLMAMSERYNERATGFLVGWSEAYPPFDFTPGAKDNGVYRPITLNFREISDDVPRSVALNIVKAIPHYIVIFVFAIGAVAVAIAAWFAVLFTGAWPKSLRDFLVRFTNYTYRVWSYVIMVENDYPRFGLQ